MDICSYAAGLVTNHQTPVTYDDAMASPDAVHWKRAIEEELVSLKNCAVWKTVVLSAMSPGSKAIPTKWVFKIKSDGHGNVARYKARLVVCGYRQKLERDYDLTFAPVAHAASIRTILALAVHLGLVLRQFDVKTAFLYGELPKSQTVYLQPPRVVAVPKHHVLCLLKAMYGLKQAPLMWNNTYMAPCPNCVLQGPSMIRVYIALNKLTVSTYSSQSLLTTSSQRPPHYN